MVFAFNNQLLNMSIFAKDFMISTQAITIVLLTVVTFTDEMSYQNLKKI